jgi:hypothetical protein
VSRVIAVALDGVLRKPLDKEAQDFGAAMLYQALREHFRIIVLGGLDLEQDEHFLAINNLLGYVRVEPMRPEDGRTDEDRVSAQIRRLRAEGFHFEFLVVPDPDLAVDLLRTGQPVLLYSHPTYTAESWRPDFEGGIQPWGDLVEEISFQEQSLVEQRRKASA